MLLRIVSKSALLLLICVFALPVLAQKKNQREVKAGDERSAQTESSNPQNGKKNTRPTGENGERTAGTDSPKENRLTYKYEFSQPQFLVSHIVLEHDETGKGKIIFRKKEMDEEFTDPVQLSPITLERLQTLWTALNFLDSTENYQTADRDFSHLGVMKISLKKGERQREVEFNWTENKDAKALADEYRKISNQYIWMFDITLARQNMPLEAPRVVKILEHYLKRNEISDPLQMVPFLQELSNDERIPLIARNNAARLIKEIEKKKKQ